MAKRPTIQDLAEKAGVSVATVDRVLNGRTKVREETARRVYNAAIEIGYHATGLIEQRLRASLTEYKLGFVFQKEAQDFYRNLAHEIENAARNFHGAHVKIEVQFAKTQDVREHAELIERVGRRNQAVAGTILDHHAVTDAVARLRDQGVACFSLMNDFAQGVRTGYIGLNNLRVGRGTAWMISKVAKPGKVGLFVGGHRWHGHALRETGFRSYFREFTEGFTILDTMVNLETRQLTYEATYDLLERHPDLVGLYLAGGGMEGALQAVRELRPPDSLAFVVNEDTIETRRALQDRYLTMINVTPLDLLTQATIAQMVQSVGHSESEMPGQLFIPQGHLFPEMV